MSELTQTAERPVTEGRNLHGSFIWYELVTPDPDAAAAFYGEVLGWQARSADMAGMDYRLFSMAGVDIAGFMASPSADMPPGWLGYIGVDDVDASVADITAAGGAVHMPAMDVDGVGRMAMVADPQGAPFYVMHGASDEASQSFAWDKPRPGHCAWNELATANPDAAKAFYGDRFGWTKDGEMEMGPLGKYEFMRSAGGMFGAVMPKMPEMPVTAWTYYFRVPDIDTAQTTVTAGGGTVIQPPIEIPGGEYSMVATDPQGAVFGLVGARAGA